MLDISTTLSCSKGSSNPTPNDPTCAENLIATSGEYYVNATVLSGSALSTKFEFTINNIITPPSTEASGLIKIYSLDSALSCINYCTGITLTVVNPTIIYSLSVSMTATVN